MKKHIFRVWDNENNKYFEPTYEAWKGKLEDLHIGLTGDLFMRTMDGTIHCDSVMPGRFEIEKASHFLDGNQKVIHENDILHFKANYTSKPAGWMHGVVVRGEFEWQIKVGELLYSMDEETDEFPYSSAVEGDIHQNPELIK